MSTPSNSPKRSVAIVGGGITGLTAAWRLSRQGHEVALFEASARPGGSICSESTEGWLLERGPNSLLDGDVCVRQLIAELGLESELLQAGRGAGKRFIVRDGRVQALPTSPVSLLTTRLFSARLRLGLFLEFFQGRRERTGDVSLARFVEDHFGREAVDYALNPFVAGVYAGDPEQLSTQHAFPSLWKAEQAKGSLMRGMMAGAKERKAKGGRRGKIVSFRGGLGRLPAALAAALPAGVLHLNCPVRGLWRDAGAWRVLPATEAGEAPGSRGFDRVLLALPAHALCRLELEGEARLGPLAEIVHPPVSSLFLGYQRSQVRHALDGFGVLIPAREQRKALGVLFSSSLFEGRAPSDHVALTVMVGGMRQPELARLSLEDLLQVVQPDLAQLLGVEGPPVFARLNRWPAAIPQYNLGYGRFLALLSQVEAEHPGLVIGGNCRDGISVPNCIASGERMAMACMS